MSSNILMIDDSDYGSSQTLGAFKKVKLIEHNRDARDGMDEVHPVRGDHIGQGKAPKERYQIPAGDDFPIRVERYKLTRSRNWAPNLECSEYGGSDHLTNPFNFGDPMARDKIKTLQNEIKKSERLFEVFPDANPLNSPYKRQKHTKFLNSGLKRANGNDKPIPFENIDIDNLFEVNDICAPRNSDKVLVTVANGIRAKRSYDLAAGNWIEDFGTVNIYA